MVIPPPIPDAEPEPDIRSYHHDGNSTESLKQAGHVGPQLNDVEPKSAEQSSTATAPNAPIATELAAATSPASSAPRRPSLPSTIGDEIEPIEDPNAVHFTYWRSFRNMVRSVPVLVLVPVLCPIAWALHFSHQNPVAVFVTSLLAIIPLAGGLSFATEELALRVGDAWGGLLNASFGNAVELLVAILALVKGDLDIVQASMAGSILSNILLVLGCAYFAGGLRFHEQLYGLVGAQTQISLLGISIAAILLPEAYHLAWPDTTTSGEPSTSTFRGSANIPPEELQRILQMSRGLAFILLAVYVVFLTFQLWTHAYLFKQPRETPLQALPMPHHHRVFPRPEWVPSLRTVMSRDTWTDRSHSPPPTMPGTPMVRVSSSDSHSTASSSSSSRQPRARDYALRDPHAGHTHAATLSLPSPILNGSFREPPPALHLGEKASESTAGPASPSSRVQISPTDLESGLQRGRHDVLHAVPQTSGRFAFLALVAATALAGITAECLVDSIDGMTEKTSVSREFVGLVLLPVIGNSVEHITAVTVSLKDRLNLSISIAVGSSVQVSLCLLPLLVLLGWAIGQPMTMLFDTFETICLVVAVVLVNFALGGAGGGRTNYLQGFTLMMTYVAMALVCWFYDPRS